MLMFKILSGIAAAALGAAIMVAIPGFSPEVEAHAPPPVVKGDRLDIRPAAPTCSDQTWPYFGPDCLRRPDSGQPRQVRVVSTDRQ